MWKVPALFMLCDFALPQNDPLYREIRNHTVLEGEARFRASSTHQPPSGTKKSGKTNFSFTFLFHFSLTYFHLSWPLAVSWILRPRDVTVKVAKSTRSTRVRIDSFVENNAKTNSNNPQTTSNTHDRMLTVDKRISKLAAHTSRQYSLWCQSIYTISPNGLQPA